MIKAIVGIAVIAFGLAFAVIPWKWHLAGKKLTSEGARAIATVTARDIQKQANTTGGGQRRGKRTYYILDYVFETEDGRSVTCKRGVRKEKWDSLAVGSTIEVVYDRGDPEKGFPVGEAPAAGATLPMAMAVFGVLTVAMGAAIMLWPALARATGKTDQRSSPEEA